MAPSPVPHPSPNFGPRPEGTPIDMLVLHYTGMETAEAALARLADPEAQVSAHYLIDEDGTVYTLVEESMRAWHAGLSHWRGDSDVNARSIGIELVNPGHEFGYRPFAEALMRSLVALAQDIVSRHGIPARNVVGHSDVAPERKQDPGELFDWSALAAAGIGLWPEKQRIVAPPETGPFGEDVMISEAQRLLSLIGYDVSGTGREDAPTRAVLTAFQRRYRPGKINGRLDSETYSLIEAVHRLCTQA